MNELTDIAREHLATCVQAGTLLFVGRGVPGFAPVIDLIAPRFTGTHRVTVSVQTGGKIMPTAELIAARAGDLARSHGLGEVATSRVIAAATRDPEHWSTAASDEVADIVAEQRLAVEGLPSRQFLLDLKSRFETGKLSIKPADTTAE